VKQLARQEDIEKLAKRLSMKIAKNPKSKNYPEKGYSFSG
jgi:hypothetical protein